jgi:hypothetical protein
MFPQLIKTGACSYTPPPFFCGLFGEIRVDQLGQRRYGIIFINAVGNYVYRRAFYNAEREDAQKALRIHAPVFFFYPYAALEFICLLNEESRSRAWRPTWLFIITSLEITQATPSTSQCVVYTVSNSSSNVN